MATINPIGELANAGVQVHSDSKRGRERRGKDGKEIEKRREMEKDEKLKR